MEVYRSEVVQAEIQKRTEQEKVQGENKVEETEKVFVDEQKKLKKLQREREERTEEEEEGKWWSSLMICIHSYYWCRDH